MAHNSGYAGQVGFTDLDTIFNLNVPVEQLTEIEGNVRKVTRFKKDGNRIDHIVYDHCGAIVSKYIYGYDEQDRRSGPQFFKGKALQLDHFVKFTYDTSGKLRARQDQFDKDGGRVFHILFEYNDKRQRQQMSWYNPDGSLIRKYLFCYDKNGNRNSVECWNEKGLFQWRNRVFHNIHGDPVCILRRNGVIVFFYFQYDKNKHWLKALSIEVGIRRRWRYFVYPYFSLKRLERIVTLFNI